MKLNNIVGVGVSLLTFSSFISVAKAESWMERNPWTLKTPVVASPSYTSGYYKHVVFQGSANELNSYVQYWGLNAYVFAEGKTKVAELSFGNGRRWAVCHLTAYDEYYNTVTCVAVNSQGSSLDRNIYRQSYRTNVYDNFVAGENASRD